MTTAGWLALIFIVFLVVSINAWLIALLRGRGSKENSNMWKNASQRLRNPWEVEDRQASQLSKLVSQLKNPVQSPPPGPKDKED